MTSVAGRRSRSLGWPPCRRHAGVAASAAAGLQGRGHGSTHVEGQPAQQPPHQQGFKPPHLPAAPTENSAASPAPHCTTTALKPALSSAAAPAGVSATRRSPANDSLGTPAGGGREARGRCGKKNEPGLASPASTQLCSIRAMPRGCTKQPALLNALTHGQLAVRAALWCGACGGGCSQGRLPGRALHHHVNFMGHQVASAGRAVGSRAAARHLTLALLWQGRGWRHADARQAASRAQSGSIREVLLHGAPAALCWPPASEQQGGLQHSTHAPQPPAAGWCCQPPPHHWLQSHWRQPCPCPCHGLQEQEGGARDAGLRVSGGRPGRALMQRRNCNCHRTPCFLPFCLVPTSASSAATAARANSATAR